MSANSDYAIFPAKRLILERLSGPISYQDLVSLTEKVWNDDLYDKSYNGIIDVRHASIDMGPSSLEGVMNSNVRNLLVLRDYFLNYLIDKMTASSTFPKTLVYGPFKALVAQQVHNTL
jgi:hypothetical protein